VLAKKEDFVTLVALPLLLFSEYKQKLFFICKEELVRDFLVYFGGTFFIYEYPSPILKTRRGGGILWCIHT
jgi:hypothetical protein